MSHLRRRRHALAFTLVLCFSSVQAAVLDSFLSLWNSHTCTSCKTKEKSANASSLSDDDEEDEDDEENIREKGEKAAGSLREADIIDPFLTHGKVAPSAAGTMLDNRPPAIVAPLAGKPAPATSAPVVIEKLAPSTTSPLNRASTSTATASKISDRLALGASALMMDEDANAEDPCAFGVLGNPLDLIEAVERTLCHNPQTRAAWANAKVQTAEVGIARSAFLPTVVGTLAYSRQKNVTSYSDAMYAPLNNEAKPKLYSGGMKMSQILTDFGLRRANHDQALASLEAANATHDAALQAAFVNAAQAYFDAQTAQAVLEASREAERAARESFNGAEAKYKVGIGGLTDQLQAQVAYSKASLERVTAEGELKNAQGMLATVMGLNANTPLFLPRRQRGLPDTSFVKSADELIEDAKQNHPTLLAAKAELKAARARVEATRAEGRATVSLVAEIGRTDQRDQPPAIGYAPTNISNRNNSVGVQMNVPLFEGFGRSYRVQASQGQAEIKAAELSRLEQQISLEVWKSYQSLQTETENMKATDILLDSARQSFMVAQGRFKAGVGNILELLSAQSAVANAEQQRIKSVSKWHIARLKLAADVGKLGLWAIR